VRKKISAAILVALSLITPNHSAGQQAKPIPVYLDATVEHNDFVGQQLVFEIKETIRRSSGFRLVDESSQMPHINYRIVTLRDGNGTAVSHVFTYEDITMPLRGGYITSGVELCGQSMVKACAQRNMGNLDRAANELRALSPALWKSLR
jgi:hypothetical protein